MRKIIAILVAPLLILSGCSTAMMPVMTEVVGVSGEITESIAGYTKDASVLKEESVHKTLRNRDDEYGKAYALSGFNMEFAMMEVSPGVYAYLPKSIKYKDAPDFSTVLPVKPSEHPVWATAGSLFSTIAKYGLIGWGISEVSGVLTAGYDKMGNTYNGDASFTNSFNTAGNDQAWTGATSLPGEALPGLGGELPPGCSGMESYLAGNCGEL